MSPFIFVHATKKAHRESITERGLLPHTPYVDGNYKSQYLIRKQPRGVYGSVLPEHRIKSGWGSWPIRPSEDVWQAAVIGPLMNDPIISEAFVSLEPIPPCRLQLISTGREYPREEQS